jgi:hypothetical protein
MSIQELAAVFNNNEREAAEYVQTIGSVLADNFLQDVFANKMTMDCAIKESVKLWDKKQKDMSMQLLTGRVGNSSYGQPKMEAFTSASLDYIYETLRAA